jgi:osmotically inducible protein OsmC
MRLLPSTSGWLRTNEKHRAAAFSTGVLGEGPRITLIELDTEAEVANPDEKTFLKNVEKSKKNCPISLALTGPEIRVTARLMK